jgi:hypothetical protein
MIDTYFPHPAEFAVNLLNTCGDDLALALEWAKEYASLAVTGDPDTLELWVSVVELLQPTKSQDKWS